MRNAPSRWAGAAAAAAVASMTAAALFAVAPAVEAAEYCVTCTEPAGMYACVVAGTPADAPANAREQLVCISEIAKSGGHGSCSVPRSAPKPCPGVMKIVQAPAAAPGEPGAVGPAEGAAEVPPGTAAPAEGEPAPETVVPPAAPPKTVEELAKKTVQSSKENLEKAGENVGKAGSAVGEAAKKTWHCITSLFSDC